MQSGPGCGKLETWGRLAEKLLGITGVVSIPGALSQCTRPVVRPVARQTFHLCCTSTGISACYRNSAEDKGKIHV